MYSVPDTIFRVLPDPTRRARMKSMLVSRYHPQLSHSMRSPRSITTIPAHVVRTTDVGLSAPTT
jgi:hypothetical protein